MDEISKSPYHPLTRFLTTHCVPLYSLHDLASDRSDISIHATAITFTVLSPKEPKAGLKQAYKKIAFATSSCSETGF